MDTALRSNWRTAARPARARRRSCGSYGQGDTTGGASPEATRRGPMARSSSSPRSRRRYPRCGGPHPGTRARVRSCAPGVLSGSTYVLALRAGRSSSSHTARRSSRSARRRSRTAALLLHGVRRDGRPDGSDTLAVPHCPTGPPPTTTTTAPDTTTTTAPDTTTTAPNTTTTSRPRRRRPDTTTTTTPTRPPPRARHRQPPPRPTPTTTPRRARHDHDEHDRRHDDDGTRRAQPPTPDTSTTAATAADRAALQADDGTGPWSPLVPVRRAQRGRGHS